MLDGIETRAGAVDHRQPTTLIEQETPTEDVEKITYLSCPDCGQLMHRRNVGQQSGVVSDTCRDHGQWLDGGELRQLIRWTQAGGRRHQVAHEAENKRLEARLRRTPAPSAAPLSPLPQPPADDGSGSLFGGLGAFDVVDLVVALGSLVRALR